jgi:kynurenine formamidase
VKLLDLLRTGITVVDLAQPYRPGMPTSPTHPKFDIALRQRHGDVSRTDGITGSHELMTLGGHVGTHMDALCHVAADGRFFGGVAVEDALEDGRYRTHGIDQVRPLVRRGVLFDIPRARGRDCLPPGEPVGVDDLRAAGPEPGPGDVAVIRTGWARHWDNPPAYLGDERGVPGITLEAAAWLADRDVAAVGADTIAAEHIPPRIQPPALPVHRLLLVERGINLIEVMNLEFLARHGAAEFGFVGAPLNIAGATGAPIRPLALIEL